MSVISSIFPGADNYVRTTGVSNDRGEYINNFQDVIMKGETNSELERTAQVIAQRIAAGLDTSAQETYKSQLLQASNDTMNNGSGMETKKSTYGESYVKPINETVPAGGNWGVGGANSVPGYENATNGPLASLGAGIEAVDKIFGIVRNEDGSYAEGTPASIIAKENLVEIIKNGGTPEFLTGGTPEFLTGTDWTAVALIGGGALIVATLLKKVLK
ncbi:MAG: hypothetical protein JJE29_00445 [Peptostreptococcaceae bacterium]|nr:hypothetical protein [Peptostreptococcaceae bacterium]